MQNPQASSRDDTYHEKALHRSRNGSGPRRTKKEGQGPVRQAAPGGRQAFPGALPTQAEGQEVRPLGRPPEAASHPEGGTAGLRPAGHECGAFDRGDHYRHYGHRLGSLCPELHGLRTIEKGGPVTTESSAIFVSKEKHSPRPRTKPEGADSLLTGEYSRHQQALCMGSCHSGHFSGHTC